MRLEEVRYPVREVDVEEKSSFVWNWAQNAKVGTKDQVCQVRSESELQQLLTTSKGCVRVFGSRYSAGCMLKVHSNDMLIDISQMRKVLSYDDNSITVQAGMTLNELFEHLTLMHRMLPASPGVIAVQSLAGAIATGTHGQGLGQSTIADEALMIRMVLADGSTRDFHKNEVDFPGAQLTLGVLGIITAVTLRTVPFRVYTCRKAAVAADNLEEDLLRWNKDHAFSKAWWFLDDNRLHVWNADEATAEEYHDWIKNNRQEVKHTDQGDATLNKTIDQTLKHMHRDTQIQGKGGEQFRTVTRFRDFTDVTGDVYQVFCRGIAVPQINLEIGIDLSKTPIAIKKIKTWYAKSRPHMHYPIILRCTGPSSAWLSPARDEATCYLGFVVYYADDGTLSQDGLYFLTEVEKILVEEGGRPHWGKYYDAGQYAWRGIYPKWDLFRQLRENLDPNGRFLNDYTRELLS